ncbi:hypothetical protein [Nonomuraea roseoviolacea]|uniref:Uncharacterized protein n=1 Tax=Nonomuraea roseoviolacea subsp. carminata TaxID=160689 RepID=A0ABT1K6H6_9ACTN|nr:hypothetical protein [Nonomuraea roseoviolacea]MCP2349287.1 hypothetical protein [Nonomuraea roseoviolacea subsp. carminata]
MSSLQPTRADVEAQFVALLNGSSTRDEVDRWAAQWDGADIDDDLVWWALDKLHGVDMAHGPGGPYLHDDEQIASWLALFRSMAS